MSNLGKAAISSVAVILIAVFGMGACGLRKGEAPASITIVPPQPTATNMPTTTPAPILVFVSGEVQNPDVYTLAPKSRIKQLVEAAGGFTEKADVDVVNLAQPLTDGVHVHIPVVGEPLETRPSVVSSPAPLRGSNEIDLGSGGDLVDINAANLTELETLPGIGPVTAQKILDYRSVNGPFADIGAIMEVSGIGPAKFDQIKERISAGN